MQPSSLERVVTEADTAAALEPSLPRAASTPFVLMLAEGACHQALGDRLDAAHLSVGARAEIDHLAPTPVGARLTATATLVSAERGMFTFDVAVVQNGDAVVARVRHTRAIVPIAAIERRLAAAQAA